MKDARAGNALATKLALEVQWTSNASVASERNKTRASHYERLRTERRRNARAGNALATELALKAHRAFNLSKLTLRVAFARAMLRESRSSRKTRATPNKNLTNCGKY